MGKKRAKDRQKLKQRRNQGGKSSVSRSPEGQPEAKVAPKNVNEWAAQFDWESAVSFSDVVCRYPPCNRIFMDPDTAVAISEEKKSEDDDVVLPPPQDADDSKDVKPLGMLVCSRCKTVRYCSEDHQKLDFDRHKSECETLHELSKSEFDQPMKRWSRMMSSVRSRLDQGNPVGAEKAARRAYELACGDLQTSIENDPDGCPRYAVQYHKVQSLLALGECMSFTDPQGGLQQYKLALEVAESARPHLKQLETTIRFTLTNHFLNQKNVHAAQNCLKKIKKKEVEYKNFDCYVKFWTCTIQLYSVQGKHDTALEKAVGYASKLSEAPNIVGMDNIVDVLDSLAQPMLSAKSIGTLKSCETGRMFGDLALNLVDALPHMPTTHSFCKAYLRALFWYFSVCYKEFASLKSSEKVTLGISEQRHDDDEEEEPWLVWLDEVGGTRVVLHMFTYYKKNEHFVLPQDKKQVAIVAAQAGSLPSVLPSSLFDGIPDFSAFMPSS